jgi:acyl-CoA synthetase (AMP-forming)/AMP-acid ligase II
VVVIFIIEVHLFSLLKISVLESNAIQFLSFLDTHRFPYISRVFFCDMPWLSEVHLDIPNQDLLSWMFDHPQYSIDKPIYIDASNPSRSISCRQGKVLTKRLAAGFRKAGLKKGDCVCMHAFNDIYYPMVFLGIVAAGGVFTGTNPSYTVHELIHAINTAKIKFFISEPKFLPNVLRAAEDCRIPRSNLFVFDVLDKAESLPEGVRSLSWLQQHGEQDWERFDDKKLSESTPVARLFSSGTTGVPKALDMTHWNFVAQHTIVMEYKPRPYSVRRLLCNPMFHVSQVPRAHTSPFRGGYETFVMRRFEMKSWMENIERFEITECNVVPMMVVQILTSRLATPKIFRSIRYAWSGAAPLDKSLQSRFKNLLRRDAPFNQVWGMSETSCIATMAYYPEYDSSGSVGWFTPMLDAKLVDDEGNDISDWGSRGELCVRGPIIVNGYFENPEANTKDWDKDGFFHTGDVAYVEGPKEKRIFIVDRKKELIKVRGFQVAPAEIEAVLLHHPDITDAAVIGIKPSAEASELPRAYVVRRAGATLTEEDVRKFSSARLAKYKQLNGGIKFVEGIPKTASGKILKNQLREWAKREVGARL